MRNRPNTALLEWAAILSMLASVGVLILQLVAYSRVRSQLQPGMIVADVPVGGRSAEDAGALLSRVYAAPVELHYGDAVFLLDPTSISFRLDLESMLARADTYRTETNFWRGFWDYLWNQPGQLVSVPIEVEYSKAQLRAYLTDVAARYDAPPTAPIGDPNSLDFVEGLPGYTLDVESSMSVIDMALRVPSNRRVALTISEGDTVAPTLSTVGQLVESYVSEAGFDGVLSLVVVDLQTGEELLINPDVAYAGMSIMKIPILLATYLDWDVEPFGDTVKVIEEMIELSGNVSANILLWDLGDEDRSLGAEIVTQDLWALGLTNSFMAGFYDQETPPKVIETIANQRQDINTAPDPYMQTTPADIAMLLTMIYQCAERGGGALYVVFPGQVTQSECQAILDELTQNKLGSLIEAGVPEGTPVAHKHGFGEGDTIGDAGVVFSAGGDYVIAVYTWHPVVLEWETVAPLVANVSRIAHNYFNP
ncbi:MAG: serine hydrolase [Anaerolineales bacterium]